MAKLVDIGSKSNKLQGYPFAIWDTKNRKSQNGERKENCGKKERVPKIDLKESRGDGSGDCAKERSGNWFRIS
jgi:hypothetical protein